VGSKTAPVRVQLQIWRDPPDQEDNPGPGSGAGVYLALTATVGTVAGTAEVYTAAPLWKETAPVKGSTTPVAETPGAGTGAPSVVTPSCGASVGNMAVDPYAT
jgi:hypothetical protein